MHITSLLTDEAILAEMGARLAQARLERGLTQAELASQAGVSKRTVERIEAGASAQMLSLVRIFRVLEMLPGLEQLVPEVGPSPMDLLKLSGQRRKRARASRPADQVNESWSWDDKA